MPLVEAPGALVALEDPEHEPVRAQRLGLVEERRAHAAVLGLRIDIELLEHLPAVALGSGDGKKPEQPAVLLGKPDLLVALEDAVRDPWERLIGDGRDECPSGTRPLKETGERVFLVDTGRPKLHGS